MFHDDSLHRRRNPATKRVPGNGLQQQKTTRRLSGTFVGTVGVLGRLGDGHGGHGSSLLGKSAACPARGLSDSWALAKRPNGRTTSVGLGGCPVVTLDAAQAKALDNARAVAEGRADGELFRDGAE